MPQHSHPSHFSLTLSLLAAAFIIALPSCSGETQDLDDQELTAKTKQFSGSDNAAGDGSQAQITGDTIQETIKITGDEPKNNYQAISTVVTVPSKLSDTTNANEIKQDRVEFLKALTDYKTILNTKIYCFDQHTITDRGPVSPMKLRPCQFLTMLLETPTHFPRKIGAYYSATPCQNIFSRCRHSALILDKKYLTRANQYPENSFWGHPQHHYYHSQAHIYEHHRMRVLLDTLNFYDQKYTQIHSYPHPNNMYIFRASNNASILRVMINLAYTDISNLEPLAFSGKLVDIYGTTSLPSFLSFALLDAHRPNLTKLISHLGGQVFIPALGNTHPAGGTPHPVTTSMKTITNTTKVYAQGTKLTTKQPVAKIDSITINGSSALREDEYAVIKSAIYVNPQETTLRDDDTIKVKYLAAAATP